MDQTEKNNTNEDAKPARKTLSLKTRPKDGSGRFGGGAGRSKVVVVEKRKRRVAKPTTNDLNVENNTETAEPAAIVATDVSKISTSRQKISKPRVATTKTTTENLGKTENNARNNTAVGGLTKEEMEARSRALAAALERQSFESKQEAERAKREAVAEQKRLERLAKELEEQEKARAAAESQEQTQEKGAEQTGIVQDEANQQNNSGPEALAQSEQSKPDKQPKEIAGKVDTGTRKTTETSREDYSAKAKKGSAKLADRDEKPAQTKADRKLDERRRRGKLTLTSAFDDDDGSRKMPSMAAMRRRREREKTRARELAAASPPKKVSREVTIPEAITVQELASRMSEKATEVIKFLMNQGQMAKITDSLDAETAQLVAEEFGHRVKMFSAADIEIGLFSDDDADKDAPARPPVVTIMGHVDHGKTSLLDALRKTRVTSGEAGGITQHIGAYQIEYNNKLITFIDTPGHEAFSAMRARGANVTDIVIIVVAADEGIKPQTIEAIKHAQAADVPIIVAINKIDRPNADPERVRNELLQHSVIVESKGGSVLEVEVSALKSLGLDKLIEAIILQSEIMELRADPDRLAQGVVIEAQLDNRRGTVATILVQRGTLNVGDFIVAGLQTAKVKAMIDDLGQHLKTIGPSRPAEILGFAGIPKAGDKLAVVESDARAKEIVEYRQQLYRNKGYNTDNRVSLEHMMSLLKENNVSEFNVVIKADVQGSLEAIVATLKGIVSDEVGVNILYAGVGGISESDISIASSSEAVMLGFNVRANKQAIKAAEQHGVEIRYYNVIYNLIDDVKAAMSGMLAPERREHYYGRAEVLQVFNIGKVGRIAGCLVNDGRIERGAKVRLIRDDVVVHEGYLATLKHFKDEVKTVQSGQECGMYLANYHDMRAGDTIECFEVEEIARTL